MPFIHQPIFMSHFLKTPSGACLEVHFVGFSVACIDRFLLLARSDPGLCPAERARLLAALATTASWTSQDAQIGLLLPIRAHPRSQGEFALDGPLALAHLNMARALQHERPFVNALSKKNGWLDASGSPLALGLAFSRPVSLSAGARLEANDPGNLLGCQAAFVLFFPEQGGYYEQIGSSRYATNAPISRARIFESLRSAAKHATAKGIRKSASIVEVQTRAVRAHELAPCGDHTPLMAAIARAESLELESLMRDQETSWLRERVASLEAQRNATQSTSAPSASAPSASAPSASSASSASSRKQRL